VTITYVQGMAVDGMASYDVQLERTGRAEIVALIRFDKWTDRWAILHRTGLIERFDTLLCARAGAQTSYG
jgi:hypothetical protein